MTGRVLIVDDDTRISALLARVLTTDDISVETCDEPERALERLKEEPFDIVITDLRMPAMDGLELLRRARLIRPNCEVVLMTAHASVATARQALKQGAVDYLTKPFSVTDELKPLIHRILEDELLEDAEPHTLPLRPSGSAAGIVGHSEVLRAAISKAEKIARSDSQVLLRGESGTGKELFANLIHQLSARSDRPLVKVNCAALPDSLLESELFGYAKGAFTGADRDREGLFQAANGGTLFLDEVGEISPAFQPKLLRVLQDGMFHRLGESSRTVKVDVRVIAATNRDLEEAVKSGGFRRDLYYRLNVVPLELPALRDHLDDLPELIEELVAHFSKGRVPHFSARALETMGRYAWPGNVRELSNAVEYALVMCEAGQIDLDGLPVAIQDAARASEGAGDTLEEIEMHCILQALERTDFNRTHAARLLGITRRTLGYRIRKYELEGQIAAVQSEGRRRTRMRSVRRPAPGDAGSLGA